MASIPYAPPSTNEQGGGAGDGYHTAGCVLGGLATLPIGFSWLMKTFCGRRAAAPPQLLPVVLPAPAPAPPQHPAPPVYALPAPYVQSPAYAAPTPYAPPLPGVPAYAPSPAYAPTPYYLQSNNTTYIFESGSSGGDGLGAAMAANAAAGCAIM